MEQQLRQVGEFIYVKRQGMKNSRLQKKMSLLGAHLKSLHQKNGIKFKTGFRNLAAKKLMTPEVFQVLRNQNSTWNIDGKTFNSQQWTVLFDYMEENRVHVLTLTDILRSNLLKEIRHVRFRALEELTLSKCNILSVEILVQWELPQLKRLDLSHNQLCSIRTLNRLCNQLTVLRLQGNPITDVHLLVRAALSKLQTLQLEARHRQAVVGESIRWICKFPGARLRELYCAGRQRMREEAVLMELARRFPKGQIAVR